MHLDFVLVVQLGQLFTNMEQCYFSVQLSYRLGIEKVCKNVVGCALWSTCPHLVIHLVQHTDITGVLSEYSFKYNNKYLSLIQRDTTLQKHNNS